MPPESKPGDLLVTGIKDGDDSYHVKTKWVAGILPAKVRTVKAVALDRWLSEHGCEFCAHQVRLRLDFTCNHLERPRQALSMLEQIADA